MLWCFSPGAGGGSAGGFIRVAISFLEPDQVRNGDLVGSGVEGGRGQKKKGCARLAAAWLPVPACLAGAACCWLCWSRVWLCWRGIVANLLPVGRMPTLPSRCAAPLVPCSGILGLLLKLGVLAAGAAAVYTVLDKQGVIGKKKEEPLAPAKKKK